MISSKMLKIIFGQGTDNGLGKFNGLGFDKVNLSNGDKSNFVICFTQPHPDTLLIGTWGGGVFQYTNQQFKRYPYFHKNGNNMKLTSNKRHIVSWSRSGFEFARNQPALPGRRLAEKNNKLWIPSLTQNPPVAQRYHGGSSFFADQNGDILIYGGTLKGVWNYINDSTIVPAYTEIIGDDLVSSISQDSNGTLWLGSSGKIYSINNDKKTHKVWSKNIPKGMFIDIKFRKNNQLVCFIESNKLKDRSIVIYNTTDESNYFIKHDIDQKGLPTSLLVDKREQIWVGTDGNGLYRYSENYFDNYGSAQGLSSQFIFTIGEDEKERVWVGCRSGIFKFQQGSFIEHPLPPEVIYPEMVAITPLPSGRLAFFNPHHSLVLDGDELQPIVSIDTSVQYIGNTIGNLVRSDNKNAYTQASRSVMELTEVSNDTLTRFYINKTYLIPKGIIPYNIIHFKDNIVALATNRGIKFLSFESMSFIDSITVENGLPNNQINQLIYDQDSILWIATEGGLSSWDGKQVRAYTEEEGLISNFCRKLLVDHNNHLWIGTPHGLARFDGKAFLSFTQENGLITDDINCLFKDHKHNLWIGTSLGVSRLNLNNTNYISPALEINLSEIEVNGTLAAYEQGMIVPYQSTLRLDFSKFQSSETVLLQYKTENNNWRRIDGEFFELWKLNDGNYDFSFRVKKSNSNWSKPINFSFQVQAPLWRIWWMQVIYVVTFILSIWLTFRYFFIRQQKRNQENLALLEIQRIQELNDFKSQFFNNISHEFQTPLTLILGATEGLSQNIESQQNHKWLSVLKRNSGNMLELVSQLLTLSKLESQTLQLDIRQYDLKRILEDIASNFELLAVQKERNFSSEIHTDELFLDFDSGKIRIVLNNLLSNAFKFTSKGDSISLSCKKVEKADQPTTILIEVKDNGIGISEENLPHIFERFYQADTTSTRSYEGAGIGLALSKELVELHDGELSVTSKQGTGTSFHIQLPYTQLAVLDKAHSLVEEPISSSSDGLNITASDNTNTLELPKLLVVEDNLDMCWYIKSILSANYQISFAHNGIDGLERAINESPNIIISDIMMPQMSGTELCQLLKTDQRTSHIPVILLTAKSGQKNKLEGLRLGADVYLTKPFDQEELKLQLSNLIKQRERMRAKFLQEPESTIEEITTTPADEQFLQKAIKVVENRLEDGTFKVADFIKEIGMSRTQLHKKLKELTNQSASEFIRTIRLKKAAQLIQQKVGTITDICYQVGFNNPSHFSTEFSKLYGISPASYSKSKI